MFHSILLSIVALSALASNGAVVDREGFGIARATVVFSDAAGEVGRATTDERGRFAITLSRAPSRWEASARGYETAKLRFTDGQPLLATLRLKEPGFDETVGTDDLGVLPYQDPGWALALTPYEVVIGGSQIAVGDRGLGGSANAAIGNGSSIDAPARYLSFAGVARAQSSYGFSRTTSGRFDLGFDGPAAALGTIGGGTLHLAGLQERVGDAYAGFGTSTGDGTTATRADGVLRTNAGKLRVLASAGAFWFDDETSPPAALSYERSGKLRLELPFGDSKLRAEVAAKAKHKTPLGDYVEDESGADAKLLLRHTGDRLTSEYGAEAELATGARDYIGSKTKHYRGVVESTQVYTSQRYELGRLSATAYLAAYGLHARGSTKDVPGGIDARAGGAAANLALQWDFDDHLRLQLSGGRSEDGPSASLFFGDPIPPVMLDFSDARQATLSYRTRGGFVASATVYGERYANFVVPTTLYGRGLSVDWPIGDRWRVRAWTLGINDQAATLKASKLGASQGRDVGWLTYYASPGVRFDAIYRRETDPVEAGRYLDGDAAVVLGPYATLVVTRERHAAFSSTGLSLRFGTGSTR